MSELRLQIDAAGCELQLDEKLLARLEGGPAALLAGAGARLRGVDIEAAIERAEEWLMPFGKSLAGRQLRLRDATGRVRASVGGQSSFTPDEVERAFTRAFDDVAFGRSIDRDSVADIVLLRELVHHGNLSGVIVESG